ncbi:MAG: zinc ABC transporter substrate-binding protein, partial [Verrucomicrobiae bacterium]|nr:zinc ABC transporter substrate-binding protein [Verrucomicrobiae bacterium]
MNPFSFFPRLPFVALVATPAILVSGCGKRSPDAVPDASPPRSQAFAGNGRPRVFAVNYPLAWFAERIGGDAIDLVYPVEPGVDPAFWEPADAQIADFQSADLILRNGASYAKWAEKVTLPESTQVDTSRAFADALIEVKDAATHSHGKGGEHSHSGTAFTTWLDIRQARSQAQAVRDALAALLPGRAAEFGERFEGLAGQLDLLDADLEAVGKSLAGRPVVASHPIYQYFVRRYGLNLQSVLWEPEVVP